MMSAASPSHYRRIALAACEMRRFDPGRALDAALGEGVDPDVRAASVMTAGVLGRAERLPALRVAFAAPEAPVRHAAAWSAALLGDPGAPLFLWELAQRDAAFLLMSCELLALLPPPAGGRDPSGMPLRMGFRYAAASGDVRHVPWLLEGLADAQAARGAAEAVTTLTGADFARPPLLGTPPASFTPTPNDDPADENVALDPDECLPWPDARTARLFWDERASSFAPDARYLLGRATEEAWLGDVLRIGCQGQRALAALRLKLSHVGRPLFNVRAPVARQRKALGLEA